MDMWRADGMVDGQVEEREDGERDGETGDWVD